MRLRTAVLTIVLAAIALALVAGLADATSVKVTRAPQTVHHGQTWDALIEISRRGRRLDGFRPVVEIQDAEGQQAFHAYETGRPGVYRARVVFPRTGVWRYTVRIGDEQHPGKSFMVIPY
jgi:hypothetical protein